MCEQSQWSAAEVWEREKRQGAFGERDVLMISPNECLEGPDIVPRKKGTLTAEDKERLTTEGIPRECWGDDVLLMEARYRKDTKRFNVKPMKCENIDREYVMERIRAVMNNADKPGVVLHYIGPGKKDTGDWCFADGFITFKDIKEAYMECFQSKCLEITSDCSYSGRWVSDCRDFLNANGVKPCGHSAIEKKVLLKVKTSCRSHQISHTLLYSARGWHNDVSTGHLFQEYGGYKVEQDQHLRYLDNTVVRCKQGLSIRDRCQHNYDWNERIYLVKMKIDGRPAWQYLSVEDEDKFLEHKLLGSHISVLASGLGQDPPEDVQNEMKQWRVRKHRTSPSPSPSPSPRSRHQSTSDFPGIAFFADSVSQRITSQGATMQLPHAGISLSVPEQALSSTEPDVDLLIRPCLGGPFELPAGYEPASPAYLIQPDKKVKLQREATLVIRHYTRLQSKEDCEEMAFFSATPTPEYRQSVPVYIFKEIKSKGVFIPGSQLGEIKLKHFCFKIIGRKRKNNLYSVRLYRATSPEAPAHSALFCMCLHQPTYITLCDKRISNQYKALSLKDEFRSVDLVQLKSEKAILSVQNFEGWRVTFDRKPTEIRKEYLDLPMKFNIDELTDYPPKFLITAHPKAAAKKSVTPQLTVQGLDRELTFPVIMDCSGFSPKPSHRPPHFQAKASPTPSRGMETPPHSLELRIVLSELTSLVQEWTALGIELGFEYYEIQEIKEYHHNNVTRCKEALIAKWLKNSNQVSWEKLRDALRSKSVNHLYVADIIDKKYCNN